MGRVTVSARDDVVSRSAYDDVVAVFAASNAVEQRTWLDQMASSRLLPDEVVERGISGEGTGGRCSTLRETSGGWYRPRNPDRF